MRVTLRRVVVAALLLAVLPAAPALATPGPSRAELEAKAFGLQTRLEELYAALERISEQFDKANAIEGKLRADLASVQARQRAAAARLAAAQELLDEQARETYEAGPGWFVSELVGASDPSDLLRRVPMQRAVLEATARKLDEVRREKAELDELNARAEAVLAEQRRLDAGVLSQHERIDALTKQIQATLKGIDRRLAGVLQAQQQRAEAARRAAYDAWALSVGGRGQASWMRSGRGAAVAVAYAMRQLGKPYQWGADGPNAFDCSLPGRRHRHPAGGRRPVQCGRARRRRRPGPWRPGLLRGRPGQPRHYPPRRDVHRQGADGTRAPHRGRGAGRLDLAQRLRGRGARRGGGGEARGDPADLHGAVDPAATAYDHRAAGDRAAHDPAAGARQLDEQHPAAEFGLGHHLAVDHLGLGHHDHRAAHHRPGDLVVDLQLDHDRAEHRGRVERHRRRNLVVW